MNTLAKFVGFTWEHAVYTQQRTGKTNTGQAATNKLTSHWLQETKAVHCMYLCKNAVSRL
jgi:hypothetical protein